MTTPEFYAQTIETLHQRVTELEAENAMLAEGCDRGAAHIVQIEADLARTQEVCRDITARAEKLAAEVRQWRMCVFQDENKPFDYKTPEWLEEQAAAEGK